MTPSRIPSRTLLACSRMVCVLPPYTPLTREGEQEALGLSLPASLASKMAIVVPAGRVGTRIL